jgi:anaerobic magnesium-protoporphyrin IX monomethyl ester cyclase
MKIYFLQEFVYEYFGPMYLSAMLKKHGHQVELIVPDEEKSDWKEKIKDAGMIAFSCMTSSHKWAIKTAQEVKEKYSTTPIIFGGVHPTVFPEVINEKPIDYMARGEGDHTFLELVQKIENNEDTTNIAGIWAKKDGEIYRNEVASLPQDLDELPFPDRELYYSKYKFLRDIPTKRFMTSRGCPFQCAFCFNHVYLQMYRGKGRYLRRRSVANLIREIKEVKAKYGLKSVRFSDDTFATDKQWLKEFLIKYKEEIDLPFTFLFIAGEINDELAYLAKKAGCSSLYFGVESGNEHIRMKILCKPVRDQAIIETARILRRHKLKFGTYNMVGLPTETLKDAFKTIRLNAKIKANFPTCSIIQPYPGTKIFDFCVENNLIEEGYTPDDIITMYEKSVLKLEEKKQMENLHRFFYVGVKFPSTMPLIKKLIKLPKNPIFKLIFMASLAHRSINSMNIGLIDAFKLGIRFRKTVFQ